MGKVNKIKIYFILFLIILSIGRFFGGIYEDDEFNEKYFFIKSSPTWKWYFYSPRGMSDKELEDMTPNERDEQVMYEKFVPNRLFSFPI